MKKMNNKGMTLIEIVMAMMITAIVMTGAAGLFMMSFRMYHDTELYNQQNMILDSINNIITQEIQYTSAVTLGDMPETTMSSIQIKDGRVLKDGADLFPEEFYNGNTVDGYFQRFSRNVITVHLTLTDTQGEQVESHYLINLINIKIQILRTIAGDYESNVMYY